jgi:hypothetical protein
MVHLSRVLGSRLRAPYHWKLKWRKYVESQRLSGPIVASTYLEKGVTIVNAAMEQKEHENQMEGYFDWKPEHPMFKPAPGNGPENPRFKEIPCRIFREGTALPEGS